MPDNPYMGQYEAYALQAKTAYQKALAQISTQRGSYLQGYGLGPDGKPVADAPHGQYQQMMGGLAQQAEESDAMQRMRGFTGGISRQAAEAADRLARQTTHNFGQNFESGLTQFSQAEEGAGQDYNTGLFEKMQEITQKAIQDRLFSTPDYAGTDYPGYGQPNQPNPGTPGLPWKPPKKVVKPKPRIKRRKKKVRR